MEYKSRPDGMFANVNSFIEFLYKKEMKVKNLHTKKLTVNDWSPCSYNDETMDDNVWEYYFEKIEFNNDIKINKSKCDGIIHKKKEFTLRDKRVIKRIIKKYIKLKPHILTKIKDFKNKNFNNKKILGVHFRGAGTSRRTKREVTNIMKKIKVNEFELPFEIYFKFVDNFLKNHKNYKILICSDSKKVVDRFFKRYKNRCIKYDATISDFGELHNRGGIKYMKRGLPQNKGIKFSRYKLGEDALIEAHLLSATDFFIHGRSSLSNFVLCNKPKLKSIYVFKDVPIA